MREPDSRSEIRRRGLLGGRPSWLGVDGFRCWCDEAIDELTTDAYAFIFVSRLRSLAGHLQIKPNIDGLVFLALRQFLHERQRTHDPLGFRVFQGIRAAVLEAVGTGEVRLLGDAEISRDTVLASSNGRLTSGSVVGAVLSRWNVDGIGRRGEGWTADLVDRLERRLGRGDVRFKELVDAVKADARVRWKAVLQLKGPRCLVVPADTSPAQGPGDVMVTAEDVGPPLGDVRADDGSAHPRFGSERRNRTGFAGEVPC